jgi:hypothetical protein
MISMEIVKKVCENVKKIERNLVIFSLDLKEWDVIMHFCYN